MNIFLSAVAFSCLLVGVGSCKTRTTFKHQTTTISKQGEVNIDTLQDSVEQKINSEVWEAPKPAAGSKTDEPSKTNKRKRVF